MENTVFKRLADDRSSLLSPCATWL